MSEQGSSGGGVRLVLSLFKIALLIFILVYAIAPMAGPYKCEWAIEDLAENNPSAATFAKMDVIGSMWTRTLEDTWISALLLKDPENNAHPVTAVCRFKDINYGLEKVDFYNGNRIEGIKGVSITNFDPRAAFAPLRKKPEETPKRRVVPKQ